MQNRIPLEQGILVEFCRRHHIRRLALFGSVMTGGDRADSDIDLLVEFEHGHEPGFIALASMELELSDMMGGRKVDLRTLKDLSRHFRNEVLAHAEVQYAA